MCGRPLSNFPIGRITAPSGAPGPGNKSRHLPNRSQYPRLFWIGWRQLRSSKPKHRIAYFESGPRNGDVAILLHGFPYDIHSYVEVIPELVAAGLRVIVPYLRGHGPTRFLSSATPRSGQQGAIGADVIAMMDALGIPRAVLAGLDWGGRAACVAAALWLDRCAGLVSVNSYQIQDIRAAMTPIRPDLEAGLWYFYYFLTERGRAGLTRRRARHRQGHLDPQLPTVAFRRTDLSTGSRRHGQPGLRRGGPAFLPPPTGTSGGRSCL